MSWKDFIEGRKSSVSPEVSALMDELMELESMKTKNDSHERRIAALRKKIEVLSPTWS